MPAPVVWPFPPSDPSSVSERHGYITAISASRDKTEQRAALRKHPIGSIAYEFAAYRAKNEWDFVSGDRASLMSVVQANAASKWLVPLWPYAVTLTSNMSAGSTTLVVTDTTDSPFRTSTGVGLYALIFARASLVEVVELNVVNPSTISLVTGIARDWSFGDRVVPCRIGWLTAAVEIPNVGPDVVVGRIAFQFDTNDDVAAGAPPSEFIVMPGGGVVIPGS